ncbi:hypothetical protein B0H14DRAFT_3504411 [Mycena olivaceomarginata]|nr:hypothetical protein B0H14DRAFT_3504411 [Mycena olivaceomarginata]
MEWGYRRASVAIPPLAINPATSGRLGYSRAQPTAAFPGPAPAFPQPLLPPARLLNALRAFPPRSINPASSGRLGYSRVPPIAAFPGPAPAFPLPLLPPARLLNAGWCRWMSDAQCSAPSPGEEPLPKEDSWDEERFGVCVLNATQHVISAHTTDEDVLINSTLLKDSEFCLGLWYARKRHELMGLDPDAVPLEVRYSAELGDALVDGAELLLARNAGNLERYSIREFGGDMLTITDQTLNVEASLCKTRLRDQEFDLIAWFKTASDPFNRGRI